MFRDLVLSWVNFELKLFCRLWQFVADLPGSKVIHKWEYQSRVASYAFSQFLNGLTIAWNIGIQDYLLIYGALLDNHAQLIQNYMWCDLGKSVGSRTWWHLQFSIWFKCSFGEVHVLKTPLESVQWFQGYGQLKDSQNNRKQ